MIKRIVTITLSLFVAGCATIVSNSRYTVSVKANESDAIVSIYNRENKLIKSCKTPFEIELDADAGFFSGARYRLEFEKEGFERDVVNVCARVDSCYWMNLLCIYSAPIGMLFVDPISGAMWSFDSNMTIMGCLRPRGDLSHLKFRQNAQAYRIVSCEKDVGNEFAYRFVLDLPESAERSVQTIQEVQREFSAMLKSSYAEAHSKSDKETLDVDFSEFTLNGSRVTGRVVVLSFTVLALSYDPNTRIGRLSVRFNANQYEEARKWIRRNIETLARDKNIALTTGEIPPAAKFYLGREELKDGNVLEIEFKTE